MLMVDQQEYSKQLAAAKTTDAARDLFSGMIRSFGYDLFDACSLNSALFSDPVKATRFFICDYHLGNPLELLPEGWPADDALTRQVARSSSPIDYVAFLTNCERAPSTDIQLGIIKSFGIKRAWLFPSNTLSFLRMVTVYSKGPDPISRAKFLATRDILAGLSAVLIDRLDDQHIQANAGGDELVVVEKLPVSLTGREVDCLSLIVHGKSNEEIAKELEISVNTVRYHLKKIFKKFHTESRAELAAIAIDHSIVERKFGE